MRYQILEFDFNDNYDIVAESHSTKDAEKLFEIWCKKFSTGIYRIELFDTVTNKIIKECRVV